MSFGQSLSGLAAAAQDLDVIGNNIANSATVGFKSGTATFADVYANSRVGLGVQLASVNQDFSVGNITSTGNPYDMAIDGPKGMFRLQDQNGQILYSRNGQFFADKDNYVVNAQGQRLTGYPVGAGSTNLTTLRVPVGNIAPSPTSQMTSQINLDTNATVIDPVVTPFDPTVASTYSYSLPITTYDSLGNSHQLTQYFAKAAGTPPAQSNWNVYYRLDGNALTSPTDAAPYKMSFNGAGTLTSPVTSALTMTQPGSANALAAPLNITLDYTSSTQFGGDYSSNFSQNGYTTGNFAGVSFSPDGTMMASYTNGQTQSVGTLALATFNNLQGLQSVGGGAWIETSTSGQAIVGRPGSNGLATVKGQSVEDSNVDVSKALVSMIIAQRTYQANAQSIKTQDQVMQSLITGL